MLDPQHRRLKTPNGNYHIFTNRRPRSAALKAATKPDIIFDGVVYFSEYLPLCEMDDGKHTVYVFQVGHTSQNVSRRKAKKFKNVDQAKVPHVHKLREEELIVHKESAEEE